MSNVIYVKVVSMSNVPTRWYNKHVGHVFPVVEVPAQYEDTKLGKAMVKAPRYQLAMLSTIRDDHKMRYPECDAPIPFRGYIPLKHGVVLDEEE